MIRLSKWVRGRPGLRCRYGCCHVGRRPRAHAGHNRSVRRADRLRVRLIGDAE